MDQGEKVLGTAPLSFIFQEIIPLAVWSRLSHCLLTGLPLPGSVWSPQYHAPWWVSVSCTPGLAVPSRASSTALPCPFTAQEGAELSADTWPVLSLPCMPSCSFTHHCSDSHVSLLTQIQPKGGCTQVFPPSAPHESSPLLMLLAF